MTRNVDEKEMGCGAIDDIDVIANQINCLALEIESLPFANDGGESAPEASLEQPLQKPIVVDRKDTHLQSVVRNKVLRQTEQCEADINKMD